ncbi:hypothetical protein WOLCODRAFT_141556 [Wolfiporia cocos MD-104 SS10]|uniref:Uncharacterized protein n=1 Tax=Wolfiporia cocos (strain MD-104) TaxID=742152 RepID=A0A2H3ITA9_WOLCO|nr:hypothetical protein WOLCODRAFT_141556 [Wolfiporia cocos MD-104 SS10]
MPKTFASYFDADTDDERAASKRASKSAPTAAGRSTSASRAKVRNSALDVLKSVRTRASALVLRPVSTNVARPEPDCATARPSISSQHTAVSRATTSSYAFLSRPHTPSTRASSPPATGGDLAITRSRTKSFPGRASFLKLSKRDTALSAASLTAATSGPIVDPATLPSFFEDTGYAERNPPQPAYSRPATPAAPAPAPLRVHARLPPLRKAKSATAGVFRARKQPKKGCAVEVPDACNAFDWVPSEECFTSPRSPPPVPPLPSAVAGQKWSAEEDEGELVVPEYVFARRGSVTSTCTNSTLASCKSTSSLGERLASLLPLALPSKSKTRARSKLSLAVTVDSSPSTDSNRTWSPVTPTNFAFPPPGTGQSECGHGQDYEESAEDACRIGRVLTPEPDPFAKADIKVSRVVGADATPRGFRRDEVKVRGDGVRHYQSGWDLDGMDDTPEYDLPARHTRSRLGISPSMSRRKLPPAEFDSPSRASPTGTFTSPGSVDSFEDDRASYTFGQVPNPTQMQLVSRFSTPTCSSCSSCSIYSEEGRGEDLSADVSVDETFVFGTPMPVSHDVEPALGESPRTIPMPSPRSPDKRASVGACTSPKAHPRILARASLPASPPSSHALYAHVGSPARVAQPKFQTRSDLQTPSPARRKASVRTVASEPASRVNRPGSPFPLMRGLSDSARGGRLGRTPRSPRSPRADDDVTRVEDVFTMVAKGSEEASEKALDNSFVLPTADAVKVYLRSGSPVEPFEWRADQQPTHSNIDLEDRQTPRPPSPTGSCIRLPLAGSVHVPHSSVDSTATVTPASLRAALCAELDPACRPLSIDRAPADLAGQTNVGGEDDAECVDEGGRAQTRSRASTFYSAKSCVDSASSVLPDGA